MAHDMDMGSTSQAHTDFLPHLKAIGQSLKKRFFRKPNVTDAIEQYNLLCQELKRDGQDEFAAVCALETAKCQESLQNYSEQANVLVKAAKYFLEAKEAQSPYESDEGILHTSSQGKLQLGMQYLGKASRVYKEQQNYGLALLTTLMMAQTLYKSEQYGEALKQYRSALEIADSFFTLADQLVILEAIITCKVKMTELEGASKAVDDALHKLRKTDGDYPIAVHQKYTLRFEIKRVCLLLILGSETTDVAKFIWPVSALPEEDVESFGSYERQETLICLKSLVLAAEHGDVQEMIQVRDHLTVLLKETETDLFSILIKLYS